MNLRLAAIVALAAGAVAIAVVLRSARGEWAAFHPPREVIVRPPLMAHVAALRDVSFAGASGLRVAAWWIPSRNGAAVVLAHGSFGSRMDLAPEAVAFETAGFGALLFDWPGHGESEGGVTYGQAELEALRSAVSFVESQPGIESFPHRRARRFCRRGARRGRRRARPSPSRADARERVHRLG